MPKWLDAALDYVPSWLEFQMRAARQPGCAISIAYRGRIVLERAFGHADVDRGEPLTPRHRFRVASHTKTVTAAAIMQLAEAGRLRLGDPVGKFVTGIHARIGRLTLSQVLSHSGGIIRDGTDCGYFYGRRPYPRRDELLAALRTPPLVKPGTRFKYSNEGYALLGLIVEAAAGEPYAAWVQREIIDPLGLRETSPDMPVAAGTPLAHGHSDELLLGRRAVVPGDYSLAAIAPACGLVCTASDLAMFFSALSPHASKSVLSPSSRRAMARRRFRSEHSSANVHYGLGLVRGHVEGWDWFGHTGGLEGYVSRTKMFSAKDLTISVLANSADAAVEQWINGSVRILQMFERGGRPARKVEDWIGRWWGLWGAVDLLPVGNKVIVINPLAGNPFLDVSELHVLGPDIARIAPSPGFLFYGEAARRIRDGSGSVDELWFGGDKLLPESRRAAEMKKRLVGGPSV